MNTNLYPAFKLVNCHWNHFNNYYFLIDTNKYEWYCIFEFDNEHVLLDIELPAYKFSIVSGIMIEKYYSTSPYKYEIVTDIDNIFYRIEKVVEI